MKPFYVRHKNREEAIEVIDRAVANGAMLLEGVESHHTSGCTYSPKVWELIGVDDDSRTLFYDSPTNYGWEAEQLTIEQVREMYPFPDELVSGETKGRKFQIGDEVEYESKISYNRYTGSVVGYCNGEIIVMTNPEDGSDHYSGFKEEELEKVDQGTSLLHKVLDILYYDGWTIPEQADEIVKLFNKGEEK